MKRLTSLDNENSYIVSTDSNRAKPNGYAGEAIDKLAKFEDFFDDLQTNQSKISDEMEMLRQQDKSHSPRFKELFARKMINNSILILLKQYGLNE
jgi:hypothetical protein